MKAGGVPFEEVYALLVASDPGFKRTCDRASLPDRPDFSAVDRFLVEAGQSSVGAQRPDAHVQPATHGIRTPSSLRVLNPAKVRL